MNPGFPDLLQLALDRSKAELDWHTNGTLLPARSREIVRATSRAHKVYVSIDGGNAQTHDSNRGSGSFRKALAGLRVLLESSRDSPLRVGVYQLDLGLALHEYDSEFLELAACSTEWVRVKPVQQENLESAFNDNQAVRSLGPCFWAGNSFSIDPTGEVSICLLTHSVGGVIGNILMEDVGILLERAAAWRARLLVNGRQAVEHCRSCYKAAGDAFSLNAPPPAVMRRP